MENFKLIGHARNLGWLILLTLQTLTAFLSCLAGLINIGSLSTCLGIFVVIIRSLKIANILVELLIPVYDGLNALEYTRGNGVHLGDQLTRAGVFQGSLIGRSDFDCHLDAKLFNAPALASTNSSCLSAVRLQLIDSTVTSAKIQHANIGFHRCLSSNRVAITHELIKEI